MSRGKTSPVKSLDTKKSRSSARTVDQDQDPTKPLPRPLHEAFVQEFNREAHPLQAALHAGYSPRIADRAWPLLLKRENVQARLNALRAGGETPALRQKDVLEALVRDAFVDFSGLYEKCPRTGAVRLNLSRATPRQLNALEFRHEITVTNGRTTTRTLVTPPNRAASLRTIAGRLGLYSPGEEANGDFTITDLVNACQGPPLQPKPVARNEKE
jgi:hypothetical protein